MSKKIIIIIAVLLFMLIFLQSFFNLIYDQKFYDKEFIKNNVELDNKEDMTNELFQYFKGDAELSDKYFNEKERLHLVDVKNLIDYARIIFLFLLMVFIVLIFFMFRSSKNLSEPLKKVFRYTGIGIVCFSILSYALKNYFGYFFIRFHEIFFSNDLWMLNPATDKLIVLFPEQFFIDFVAAVYFQAIICAVILLVFSLLFQRINIAD